MQIERVRILLANKFYYPRGGDCIYLLNVERLLKRHGHEVAVFSMRYPENEESEWSGYWPSQMKRWNVLTRPFGDREVKRKFIKLLNDFRPEVVHLNNIHTQLSPVIAQLAHERGIRVVWTLHDTKLVCPCYTCMRDGQWCSDCNSDKMQVVRHRCLHDNLLGSLIGYFEGRKWNKETLQKNTDLFIAPSCFMADTCVDGGYDRGKFKVLCNFVEDEKVQNLRLEKGDYYVFLGRLTVVKGIKTLCQAASKLPYKLIIIGGGELEKELRLAYADSGQITFVGKKGWEDIRPLLEGARFMVLPAEWSENNPLTVIEAQSLGTPVLGARIGGIPELIEEGISGMTFRSGDVNDLKEKIQQMFEKKFDYSQIAKEAIKRYSSEVYYKNLMQCYTSEEGKRNK